MVPMLAGGSLPIEQQHINEQVFAFGQQCYPPLLNPTTLAAMTQGLWPCWLLIQLNPSMQSLVLCAVPCSTSKSHSASHAVSSSGRCVRVRIDVSMVPSKCRSSRRTRRSKDDFVLMISTFGGGGERYQLGCNAERCPGAGVGMKAMTKLKLHEHAEPLSLVTTRT